MRHAEPIPPGTPGWEERDDERPLTEEGRLAAEQLADELEPYVITSTYSSPYPRAIETVTPTAQRRGLEVHLLPDLRERRLTLQPASDWSDHLARSWADPHIRWRARSRAGRRSAARWPCSTCSGRAMRTAAAC